MKLRAQTISRLSLYHPDVICVTFLGNEKKSLCICGKRGKTNSFFFLAVFYITNTYCYVLFIPLTGI